MDLFAFLERAGLLYAESPATAEDGSTRDYAQLLERCRRLAAALARLGIAPGTRLAVLQDNGAAFLELYFAAAALGAILVPLNTRLAPPELVAILDDCQAPLLCSTARLESLARAAAAGARRPCALAWSGSVDSPLRAAGELALESLCASPAAGWSAPRARAADVAQLYYTSGTTGRPKGVMLTHANVSSHALAAIGELQLSQRDTWGHFAPMFHLADAWATFALTAVGGRHVFAARFQPEHVLHQIESQRITLTNLIPTMLNALLAHPDARSTDFSSLRLLLSGGAPIAPQLVRRVIEVCGCEYVNTYGMTETSPYLTLSRLSEELRALPPEEQLHWRARTGRPFLGIELEIVDEQGALVPRDGRSVGEIRVRGASVTPGYWQRPEETAAALRAGWLYTGDLAEWDTRGYIGIVDRKQDMLISGGEKIYSTEVEHVLCDHPAVFEAAVFGLPDAQWGERAHAAVVLRPGCSADAQELIAHCRARLAHYKAPRSVRFLEQLPRTGSGKLSKRLLRESGG